MSRSKLVLSNLGNNIKTLSIIADNNWPSWLYIIDLFLESSTSLTSVIVYTPSFDCLNLFGTCRKSKIKWKKFDLHHSSMSQHSRCASALISSDLILYSGSFSGFKILKPMLNYDSSIIVMLNDSNLRLRKLSYYQGYHWKRIRHASIGGVTSSSYWLGSSSSFRSSDASTPTYCRTATRDLLEFAPKSVQHFDRPIVLQDLC